LPLPAGAQYEPQPSRRGEAQTVEPAGSLLELHATLERRQLLRGRLGLDVDLVFALVAEPRMQHTLGPRAVVRQEDQPFGVGVEAADRVEPFTCADQ